MLTQAGKLVLVSMRVTRSLVTFCWNFLVLALRALPLRRSVSCLRREQLLQRFRKREPFLEVDLRVLSAYDLLMHDLILKQPNEFIPVVRCAHH